MSAIQMCRQTRADTRMHTHTHTYKYKYCYYYLPPLPSICFLYVIIPYCATICASVGAWRG